LKPKIDELGRSAPLFDSDFDKLDKPKTIEQLYGIFWNSDSTEFEKKLALRNLEDKHEISKDEIELFTQYINPLKISVEYHEFIKKETPKVLAYIKEFVNFKENNFLQDKYDLGLRFSMMKLYTICNPLFTLFSDHNSVLSPKWYRAIYWYYFAISHAFSYCYFLKTMHSPPLERDSKWYYPFT